MNILRLTAMCMMIGSVAGVATANAKDRKSHMGDSWITAKTKIALFADSRVKGTEINVETKAGIVMIRGKVDDDAAKSAAGEIAKSVDGAKSVKNELAIVPRAMRDVVEDRDEIILKNVQDQLKSIDHSNAIGVKVNAGIVSLNGEIGSMAKSAKASWKAWLVKGVKSVKNDITVKS